MKEYYVAHLSDLIVLCHIDNKFNEFNEEMIEFISQNCNKDSLFKLGYKLWQVSTGEFCFNSKKIKEFYQSNKEIIDLINQYSNIGTFLSMNYIQETKVYSDDNLVFFHKYILNHQEEKNKIIKLLEKIKKLGFTKIKFDNSSNFTNEIYEISNTPKDNTDLVYFDNIEVLPCYRDCLKYQTKGSNYKMVLNYSNKPNNNSFAKEIIVNSLVFESSKLPDSINIETLLNHIIKSKDRQEESFDAVRNSVDLSITIEELDVQLNKTLAVINDLNNVNSKKELLDLLVDIKEDIEELKMISIDYDDSILDENVSVTREILEKEKRVFKTKRLNKQS